ncbi:MAG: hypothetical protein AB7U61_07500 [Methylocystis sp.]
MAKADTAKPKAKAKTKPKLTDKERHKRFVEMAHSVEADDRPEAFERAFELVVQAGKPKPPSQP